MHSDGKTPDQQRYSLTFEVSSLAISAQLMLTILLIINIMAMISNAMELHLLNRMEQEVQGNFGPMGLMPVTEEEIRVNDLRQLAMILTSLLAIIVTCIPFLKWVYHANSNCHGFGAPGLKFTPDLAVASFFIPIVNIWKPSQALREIARASTDPKYWWQQDSPPVISGWWACYLGSVVCCAAGYSTRFSATEIFAPNEMLGGICLSSALVLVGNGLSLPAAITGVKVVSHITTKQKALVSRGETPA